MRLSKNGASDGWAKRYAGQEVEVIDDFDALGDPVMDQALSRKVVVAKDGQLLVAMLSFANPDVGILSKINDSYIEERECLTSVESG